MLVTQTKCAALCDYTQALPVQAVGEGEEVVAQVVHVQAVHVKGVLKAL